MSYRFPTATPMVTTGIPIGIPSSGSFAANGALTGLATFTNTYPDCFLFFPANAIGVGVPAGLYYTQMSSGTAGTVFQNSYVYNQPTIPANPIPWVIAGPGAYTQTVGSNIDIITLQIKGGSLGSNGGIFCNGNLATANNANNHFINAFLRTTAGANSQIFNTTFTNAANSPFELLTWNSGKANQQISTGTNTSGYTQTGSVPSISALNSNIDFLYVLQLQISVAATDFALFSGLQISTILT